MLTRRIAQRVCVVAQLKELPLTVREARGLCPLLHAMAVHCMHTHARRAECQRRGYALVCD